MNDEHNTLMPTENSDTQKPAPPAKKESFLHRMQRRGVLVIKPPSPGELDVLAKLRESAAGHLPPTYSVTGEENK